MRLRELVVNIDHLSLRVIRNMKGVGLAWVYLDRRERCAAGNVTVECSAEWGKDDVLVGLQRAKGGYVTWVDGVHQIAAQHALHCMKVTQCKDNMP